MKKILVIEDEYAVKSSIRDILEESSYQVFTASDGREGISVAAEIKPDLVICDIMMPGVDGFQVIHSLRENKVTASIPFIFLTAKAEMSDLRAGMELGADDYIVKPFKAVHLLKAIETRLNKYNAIKEGTKSTSETDIDKHEGQLDENQRFFLTVKDKPKFVRVGDIVCITALSEYSSLFLIDGNKLVVRKLLKEWEAKLPAALFVRIHRSTIINLNYVVKVEKWYKRTYKVHLKNMQESFTISQRYATKIKAHILA